MLRAMRPEPARVSSPNQAGEDLGHLAARHCAIGADEAIGAVLRPRQGGGLRIGSGLRQRIDRGAAHRMVRQRVRVHRHKQRRAIALRPLHPVVQRDEHVACPGELNPISAAGLKTALEFQRGGKRDMLLERAGHTDRAGVLAAMARVQHHQRRGGLGLPRRVRALRAYGDRAAGWPPSRHAAGLAEGTCRRRTSHCQTVQQHTTGDRGSRMAHGTILTYWVRIVELGR